MNQRNIPDENDELLKAAITRLEHLNKWWPRLFSWNCWLSGTAVILSGIVPFGLGMLLYIPKEYSKGLNIILLVLTGIAFVVEVWNTTQRNRDRALHLRSIACELGSLIASYQSGVISRKKFSMAFKELSAKDAQEPAP